MKITMTLREALAIQSQQIEWYSRHRADLAQAVAAKTHIPDGIDLDTPMPVHEINAYVPRGADIEYLCGLVNHSQD